jgi:hypothetical protein
MGFFCVFWIPLFYFFRRSIFAEKNGMGWWALILGSAAVLVRYFTGPFVPPVGFGLSCWLNVFFDIVSLPVLVPILVCVVLIAFRLFPSDVDIGGFTFLWLVPMAFYYSVDRPLLYSPLMLILVPLLWTTQALGVSFFIDCILEYRRWYIVILLIPAAAAMPFIAASSWWAFYSQQTQTGCLFLFASVVPALVSLIAESGAGRKERHSERRKQVQPVGDQGSLSCP